MKLWIEDLTSFHSRRQSEVQLRGFVTFGGAQNGLFKYHVSPVRWSSRFSNFVSIPPPHDEVSQSHPRSLQNKCQRLHVLESLCQNMNVTWKLSGPKMDKCLNTCQNMCVTWDLPDQMSGCQSWCQNIDRHLRFMSENGSEDIDKWLDMTYLYNGHPYYQHIYIYGINDIPTFCQNILVMVGDHTKWSMFSAEVGHQMLWMPWHWSYILDIPRT